MPVDRARFFGRPRRAARRASARAARRTGSARAPHRSRPSPQVSAANAQKRRNASDKKMMANVNKRGLVPDMAEERRKGKLSVGPLLLGFFVFVIIGSSLLQVIQSAGAKR